MWLSCAQPPARHGIVRAVETQRAHRHVHSLLQALRQEFKQSNAKGPAASHLAAGAAAMPSASAGGAAGCHMCPAGCREVNLERGRQLTIHRVLMTSRADAGMTGASRMICHSRNAAQRAVGRQGTTLLRIRYASVAAGQTIQTTTHGRLRETASNTRMLHLACCSAAWAPSGSL